MRTHILTLLLLLTATFAFADTRITKTYTRRPLPEVLIDIDKTAPEVNIRFIYNKLEDYLVTCSLHSATPLEAVQQAVGFYPIKVSRKDSIVIVEPVYETDRKIIGRVVNEKGQPLEFANISLYTADSIFVTGGVTNSNGDFVVPCTQKKAIARITFIGYKPFARAFDFRNGENSLKAGTIVLKEDPQTLREVVVEQDIAITSAEKSTYFPTKRQRNAAADATALLQLMMIPQLRVNPASGYITTLSGESVSVFIDHIPATAEDLEGMNTQDVKRVEIYDFPKDVRFQNKPHVVNFVMQRYEVGGYTKLTDTEMIMADYTILGSVYSKLVHKNWTFDANISYRFFGQSHIGNESDETFNLPRQTIKRTELSEDGRQDKDNTSASLRATYNTEKIQFANRLELLDERTLLQDIYGSVTYKPALFSTTNSTSHLTASDITPTFSGDWNFSLPKDWSLYAKPRFQYSHNKMNRFYQEGEMLPIENKIKEDAHIFEWEAALGKSFAQKHSIELQSYGMNLVSDLEYTGSTVSQSKLAILTVGQGIKYIFQTDKLSLSSELLLAYQKDRVNGETNMQTYPISNTNISYAFNSRNSLTGFVGYNNGEADGAMRNPNVMQENELLFYCGNPALKNYQQLNTWVQYTWLPSNKLSSSIYIMNNHFHNNIAYIWEPINNGEALIRRYGNIDDVNNLEIGASLTLRLLDGKLSLSTYPKMNCQRISGLYNESKETYYLDLRANYYIGQFYIFAGYNTPEKTYEREKVYWQQSRSHYYLIAGWGNAHWKARLEYVNPFRTDWRATRRTITTPVYTRNSTALNNNAHQHLTFKLTYILNYGKKVKQGNELGTASGGQSSIL